MKLFNIIFVIIGVIIGAGFASGQEIYAFFFRFGKYGFLGMAIAIILIGIAIYKTLKIIKKYEIENYDDLLNVIIGDVENKKINIKIILNFIINIFLLITFFVMCAGFSAYFKQEYGINEIISSCAISIVCYFTLSKNINGVVLINSILIPFIILILIILGVKAIDVQKPIQEIQVNCEWILNAILYASYNSITLVSILMPMKKYIKYKKDILKISIISIVIIAILSVVVFILLLSINEDINKIELPTVYASRNFGYIYQYLYGIIILGAIITSAISSAYGFLNNVSENKTKYKINNILICFVAIFISLFGFSNLVNSLYPLFGLLGLIQLIYILKCKTLY